MFLPNALLKSSMIHMGSVRIRVIWDIPGERDERSIIYDRFVKRLDLKIKLELCLWLCERSLVPFRRNHKSRLLMIRLLLWFWLEKVVDRVYVTVPVNCVIYENYDKKCQRGNGGYECTVRGEGQYARNGGAVRVRGRPCYDVCTIFNPEVFMWYSVFI